MSRRAIRKGARARAAVHWADEGRVHAGRWKRRVQQHPAETKGSGFANRV